MVTYPVFTVTNVVRQQRYGTPAWPLEQLEVGQGFFVPLTNGKDPDGRSSSYVRTLVNKAGRRLGRRFSANMVEGGLLVSRGA